jgi:transcriptional regulator with XRE-family HTH domain
MAKINETLRELRREQKLTQEEVAQRLNVTRQAISNYESGRTEPGLDILQKLAEVYKVELTEIIYGRGKSDPLKKPLKWTATAVLVIALVGGLVTSALRWSAGYFFPLTFGQQVSAGTEQWVDLQRHFAMSGAADTVEGIYSGIVGTGWMILFVLSLCRKQLLPTREKLKFALCFCVGITAATLPWGLLDPVMGHVNYIITPFNCAVELVFFLLLSILIDWIRLRHREKSAPSAEER